MHASWSPAENALPGHVSIDGSMLEGGGQILRNATALAAITKQSINISKIRAGRPKPGLAPQHLTGLQLITNMSGGTLLGATLRSTSITFKPTSLTGGHYIGNTATAGSCALLVQQSLPCLLYEGMPQPGAAQPAAAAAGEAHISGDALEQSTAGRSSSSSIAVLCGGTDAAAAPPVDYIRHVLLPLLQQQLGVGVGLDLVRRGFYPRGGGEVHLKVTALAPGAALPALNLMRRGKVVSIEIHAFTAGRVKEATAQVMAATARAVLLKGLGTAEQAGLAASCRAAEQVPDSQAQVAAAPACHPAAGCPGGPALNTHVSYEAREAAVGDGGGLLLVALMDSGARLGWAHPLERGVAGESLAQEGAEALLACLASGAAVDEWAQDQVIVFMALARGVSSMVCGPLTLHTRTAMAVAEQLLPGKASFKVQQILPIVTGGPPANETTTVQIPASAGGDDEAPLFLVTCQSSGIVND